MFSNIFLADLRRFFVSDCTISDHLRDLHLR